MAQDFLLPDIGEGITEYELVEWLVKEGDRVVEDQAVADVMTDKALVQIPSMHNGVITRLHHKKGDIAKVHAPLFSIQLDDEIIEKPDQEISVDATPVAQVESSPSTSTIKEFLLPDLGEGIIECEVVDWLVAVGDEIVEDQPICDVMTDKALVQIPAMENGIVTQLFSEKGSFASVHAPLFSYSVTGDESQVVNANDVKFNDTASHKKITNNTISQSEDSTVNNEKVIASPAVRRVARELNIDLKTVIGSGKNGRVYKDDLLKSSTQEAITSTTAVEHTKAVLTGASATKTFALDVSSIEPVKGIKAAMARQMVDSVRSIPHITFCEDIDLSELIALRDDMKEAYRELGVTLTMMPFFIKSLSLALEQFPIINSQIKKSSDNSGDEIHYFSQHNIGMAVDSKIGLLVPNIKNVQDLSIVDVSNEVSRLVDAARAGRLASYDMKYGTITISNIGAIGGTIATPIINKPEVAIVALGKVQKLPRFDNAGNVVARQIMNVSWSADHRVIDGGTIARFCNLWKSYLENPSSMMKTMS